MLDAFRTELKMSRALLPWLTVAGAVAAGAMSLILMNANDTFANMFAVDTYTGYFRVLFAATLVVVVVGSHEFVTKEIRHQGEFYAMVLFATLGANFMASSRESLTPYVASDLAPFSLYVPVSLAKQDRPSG